MKSCRADPQVQGGADRAGAAVVPSGPSDLTECPQSTRRSLQRARRNSRSRSPTLSCTHVWSTMVALRRHVRWPPFHATTHSSPRGRDAVARHGAVAGERDSSSLRCSVRTREPPNSRMSRSRSRASAAPSACASSAGLRAAPAAWRYGGQVDAESRQQFTLLVCGGEVEWRGAEYLRNQQRCCGTARASVDPSAFRRRCARVRRACRR